MKWSNIKRLKKIITFILIVLLTAGVSAAVIFKVETPYRVSIYNYESYLAKPLIKKLNKKYSYRVFSDINEFTKGINQGKTVGGVGSDFQIANLLYEGKLKKINYDLLINNLSKDPNERKKQIQSHFTEIVNNHIEKYQNWMINKIIETNPNNEEKYNSDGRVLRPFLYYKNPNAVDKNNPNNILGFEADSKQGIDNFYEFIIPYFIQDKIIAYNINSQSRPYIKKHFDGEDFNKKDWLSIYSKLQDAGYRKYGWTNSYYDNLMLGQFYATENNKHNYIHDGNLENINSKNIDDIINYFKEFVHKATGYKILNTSHNKLVTNGLELVNDLIDPTQGKLDVGLMYNGDVLDSYYSNDNFSNLEDGKNVNYIRPKNNMILLDSWIISNSVNDNDSDNMIRDLKETIFESFDLSYNDIVSRYYENVIKNILAKNNTQNTEKIHSELFKKDNLPKKLEEISTEFFNENIDAFGDFSFSDTIQNFDTINYTPTYKNVFDFIQNYYFIEKDKKINIKAQNIYNIDLKKGINYQFYRPVDNELKSEIVKKYFEQTHS